jgi:outer membrane protein assembly factor BamB
VVALDPVAGKELWTCRGLNELVYTSPLYGNGIVVAMGGYGGTALAARVGDKGDVTATHRLWTRPKEQQRIGSGVLYAGHIYILNATGVAQCINVKSGKMAWEERLKGKGASGGSWSSMVLADEKIYAINQSADTFILKARPKFELLATNSLGEMTQSSIAVSDGELFIRTYEHLWCISNEK